MAGTQAAMKRLLPTILALTTFIVAAHHARAGAGDAPIDRDPVMARATATLSLATPGAGPIEAKDLNIVHAHVGADGLGTLLVLRSKETVIGYLGLRPGGSIQYVHIESGYRGRRAGELLYLAAGYFLHSTAKKSLCSDLLNRASGAVWKSFHNRGIAVKTARGYALAEDAYSENGILRGAGRFWSTRFRQIENWKAEDFIEFWRAYDGYLEFHLD